MLCKRTPSTSKSTLHKYFDINLLLYASFTTSVLSSSPLLSFHIYHPLFLFALHIFSPLLYSRSCIRSHIPLRGHEDFTNISLVLCRSCDSIANFHFIPNVFSFLGMFSPYFRGVVSLSLMGTRRFPSFGLHIGNKVTHCYK
ncbi:hypothetical protein, unlikely [Trypanosoma brucei brucei TREU927]|uniref:Uncharacterized protein n=1 Tax=Trypanosoma brucei brucei (strain 927/4 GUTat10.1) TaxID=185431 RepID=Q38D14_TRYB2|nr:hypothetical protein, unlikely [Trypanosoma brucei brucei TREU927]EAN77306.1 hypothetical protein, unlikely [Trypanosoma brucei brucei TREU927]